MWKQILTLIQTVFTLAKDLEESRDEIKELRRDVLNLTLTVQRLSDEIKLTNQREASEREKLELRLENSLLKFEKAIPAVPTIQTPPAASLTRRLKKLDEAKSAEKSIPDAGA